MNAYLEEYRQKLCTPEQAVQLVKDGDWVDYSQTLSFPVALDAALAADPIPRTCRCLPAHRMR